MALSPGLAPCNSQMEGKPIFPEVSAQHYGHPET